MGQRLRLLTEVDVAETLGAVEVPMLYLQAGRDRLVPAHNLADLRRIRPDLGAVVIDAPHLLLQRRPVEALAAIRAWWDGQKRGRPRGAQRGR